MHCLNFRVSSFSLKKGAMTAPSFNEWKGKPMNQISGFRFCFRKGLLKPLLYKMSQNTEGYSVFQIKKFRCWHEKKGLNSPSILPEHIGDRTIKLSSKGVAGVHLCGWEIILCFIYGKLSCPPLTI